MILEIQKGIPLEVRADLGNGNELRSAKGPGWWRKQVGNSRLGVSKACAVSRPAWTQAGTFMVVIRRNAVDLIVSGAADIRADIGNFDVLVVYMNRKPSL